MRLLRYEHFFSDYPRPLAPLVFHFLRASFFAFALHASLPPSDCFSSLLSEPIWCKEDDHWQRPCTEQRRLQADTKESNNRPTVRAALERALSRELGAGPWVAGIAGPFVYLYPRRASSLDDRKRVLAVANTVLREGLGVQSVIDAQAMARACSPAGPNGLLCRSLSPDLAADLFLVLQPGDFFDADLDAGSGTNHGSPALFDRAVPLLVRAPGKVAAGTTIASPVRFDAFARTLGCLLGLSETILASAGRNLCRPSR